MLCLQTLPSAFGELQTDFPNYFVSAKIATEGIDAAHLYEWRWLARQKDHFAVDRALIGLVPITPFSTLAITPLTHLTALNAKRVWLALQLALLFPIALGLHAVTGQPLRRIALIILACEPLHRNLLYGQFYIPVVGLLVAACWAHGRKRPAVAGSLLALATALKLFPFVFFLYLARKRQWSALLAGALTGLACAALSIAVFGREVHRTYLAQVLPWTLRGEALPPFALGSSSLSTLLHCLFLYEPQWNPHPWHLAPTLFAVLNVVLPMLILAPALLLVDERDTTPTRLALEYSALTVATLTISTIPASYNFTLLIFPMTVLCAHLFQKDVVARTPKTVVILSAAKDPCIPSTPATPSTRIILVALTLALYAGICYPSGWHVGPATGLGVLLQIPRLYCLLLFLALFYAALGTTALQLPTLRRNTLTVALALTLILFGQIASGIHHQRGLYDDFQYRLPDSSGALLAASPQSFAGRTLRVAMQPGGYRLLPVTTTAPAPAPWPERSVGPDEITFAASADDLITESAGPHSTLLSRARRFTLPDAESPVLSADGSTLAYLRVDHGRARLALRPARAPSAPETLLTPPTWNVEGATFLPGNGSLIVSALTPAQTGMHLYRIAPAQPPQLLPLGEARFPAVSPDGHWLAFSRFTAGNWNLTLLNLQSGAIHPITTAACNTTEPAWQPDSKTILYSTDCGRALWFTATARRQIIP